MLRRAAVFVGSASPVVVAITAYARSQQPTNHLVHHSVIRALTYAGMGRSALAGYAIIIEISSVVLAISWAFVLTAPPVAPSLVAAVPGYFFGGFISDWARGDSFWDSGLLSVFILVAAIIATRRRIACLRAEYVRFAKGYDSAADYRRIMSDHFATLSRPAISNPLVEQRTRSAAEIASASALHARMNRPRAALTCANALPPNPAEPESEPPQHDLA